MKKFRVTILLAILISILSLWTINPQLLQNWIYAAIGEPAVAYLMVTYGQKSDQESVSVAMSTNMTPMNLLEITESKYQLKPDRRFIQAAEYLQSFISGQALVPAELEWVDKQWQIKLGNSVIGTLPPYPSFHQGMDFLHSWGEELIKIHGFKAIPAVTIPPLAAAGIDGFNPTALMESLNRLNSRWSTSGASGETLHNASVYLTRLALINRDFIQLGDMHNSRSMAVLSLAGLINQAQDYNEQKSQLAYTMGYTADAEQFTDLLPQDNLWRGFIRQDDELLMHHLAENNPPTEAHYYRLVRLAQLGKSTEWMEQLSRYYLTERIPVHALLTGYELKQSNLYSYLAHTIPLVMVELTGGKPVWDYLVSEVMTLLPRDQRELAKPILDTLRRLLEPGLRTVLAKFDQKIDDEMPGYQGPFLDGMHWKSYQKSLLLNSVYKQGIYSLDYFNNPDNTEYIASQLVASDSEEAKLIGRYLQVLVKASNNEASNDEVSQAILVLVQLGPTPVFRLYEEIASKYAYGSTEAAAIVINMVSTIDSRIDARYDYANAMSQYLLNVGIAERVYATIALDSPADSLRIRAWRGFYFRDFDALYRLLDDHRLTFETAQYIANRLKTRNLSDSDLDRFFLKIIDRYPSRLVLRRTYVEILEARKRYGEGLIVMLHWHKNYANKFHQNIRFRALTYIARIYRKKGQLQKAKEVLQLTLNDSYGFGYYEATEIEIAEGQFKDAVRIAEEVRSRYPNSNFSLKNSLRAYWANGDFSKAARLLKDAPQFSHGFWRASLGEIFSELFKTDSARGAAAVEALVTEGLPSIKIGEFVRTANANGLHELAFNASNQLKYKGSSNFVYKLYAYNALKNWKGKQVALDWLNQQYSEEEKNALSPIIYYQGEYGLLWDFITTPEKGSHPYGVWYMRAAAQVMGATRNEARNQRLQAYYGDAGHNNFYDDLGRLALGIDSGETMLNTSYSTKRLGEISYYKGVYEYSQGRYQEAANWFRATVETRLQTNGEYRWAHGTLYTWSSKNTELRLQIENPL